MTGRWIQPGRDVVLDSRELESPVEVIDPRIDVHAQFAHPGMFKEIAAYVQACRARFVAELQEFVRFPSVSAQPRHAGDVKRCAEWLADHLKGIGFKQARVISTAGHPIVRADWRHRPGRPTVMIYGHYDVQPPDPLDEWRTPPFNASIKGEELLGRGASDDKGQLFTHVKALEAYLHCIGELPVNVHCLFEGEEEVGSENLLSYLEQFQEELASDVAVVSDTRMLGPDRPAITYALRGALSVELEVHGPAQDLHSGNFGGAIHNPLQGLCEMVASLHDARGRIAIPGFYHRVRSWSQAEREYMAGAGPSHRQILADAGASEGWGEEGYTLYERTTIRPSLAINGVSGGYQGPGAKAVIPAKASAKLNFRLVPDQDPNDIEALVRRHIARITPSGIRADVTTQFAAPPTLVNRQSPVMRAAAEACRRAFGATPVFLRSGGTIPVVSAFKNLLDCPTVLMGFALPDDRLHAPNEKFHLPTFFRGIHASIEFLSRAGRVL